MKKKLFSLIITVAMLVSLLAPMGNLVQASGMTLHISPSSGTAGDSVTIQVSGHISQVNEFADTVTITIGAFTGNNQFTTSVDNNGYYSDNCTGTLQSPSTTTDYTVSAVYGTQYHTYASASQTFTVNATPALSIKFTSALSVSLSASTTSAVTNQPVTFTASASGGSGTKTYSWTGLGSGSTNGSSATGKWSSSGSKTVTVTVTDSSGSASANI